MGERESYFGTFTDFDLFLLAIAADLSTHRRLRALPPSPSLEEMADAAYQMHRKGVVPIEGGGWLFQPGAWDDHPDYRYSAHDSIAPDIAARPGRNMASDASHASRFPLWLHSHALASAGTGRAAYYEDLRRGLCHQFLTAVVEPPTLAHRLPAFRNFMDGRNGVYRLNYLARGEGWGYGPYHLSGTVMMGWWGFLRTPEIGALYEHLAGSFPYSAKEIARFAGPTRSAAQYESGTYQLLTRLAARIARGSDGRIPVSSDELATWNSRLAPALETPLWAGGSAESGQYLLMVPLHSAFTEGRVSWSRQFVAHFGRYARAERAPAATFLGKLHYMYFASRFTVLAATHGDGEAAALSDTVATILEAEVLQAWEGRPPVVSQTGWGEPPFPNFKSYIAWKLARETDYRAGPRMVRPTRTLPPDACRPSLASHPE